MIKILQGGHYRKKGYYYTLYITLPKFLRSRCRSISGSEMTTKKLELPTGFLLTSNNVYSNIVISLFGFGIGLEIHSKS
jgi:hypothetical protein